MLQKLYYYKYLEISNYFYNIFIRDNYLLSNPMIFELKIVFLVKLNPCLMKINCQSKLHMFYKLLKYY